MCSHFKGFVVKQISLSLFSAMNIHMYIFVRTFVPIRFCSDSSDFVLEYLCSDETSVVSVMRFANNLIVVVSGMHLLRSFCFGYLAFFIGGLFCVLETIEHFFLIRAVYS